MCFSQSDELRCRQPAFARCSLERRRALSSHSRCTPTCPGGFGQALNHVVGFMNLTRWIGVCRPKVEWITLLSAVAPSMMNRRGRKMAEGERYVIQPFNGETRLPIQ